MEIIKVLIKGLPSALCYAYPYYNANIDMSDGFLFVTNTETEMRVLTVPVSELQCVILTEEADNGHTT